MIPKGTIQWGSTFKRFGCRCPHAYHVDAKVNREADEVMYRFWCVLRLVFTLTEPIKHYGGIYQRADRLNKRGPEICEEAQMEELL